MARAHATQRPGSDRETFSARHLKEAQQPSAPSLPRRLRWAVFHAQNLLDGNQDAGSRARFEASPPAKRINGAMAPGVAHARAPD